MTRIIRRAGRTSGATPVYPTTTALNAEQLRKLGEEKITASLKAIALAQRKIEDQDKLIEEQRVLIEATLKEIKASNFTDGVLQAALVEKWSNEKKEIDPKLLFNSKGVKREDFFSMVKVQIGEAAKFLSANEIGALATITPPKKQGIELVIKPVPKVAAAKPATKRGKK
jgi:hypothetical protein